MAFKRGDPLTAEALAKHRLDIFTRAKDQPFYWVCEAILNEREGAATKAAPRKKTRRKKTTSKK